LLACQPPDVGFDKDVVLLVMVPHLIGLDFTDIKKTWSKDFYQFGTQSQSGATL